MWLMGADMTGLFFIVGFLLYFAGKVVEKKIFSSPSRTTRLNVVYMALHGLAIFCGGLGLFWVSLASHGLPKGFLLLCSFVAVVAGVAILAIGFFSVKRRDEYVRSVIERTKLRSD